ncbi:MAG: hypothetical protein OEV42_06960 [Deltaproteobacteria bacterium]|nr:hypothetical protein [Deltaproteobacteria bacterium]
MSKSAAKTFIILILLLVPHVSVAVAVTVESIAATVEDRIITTGEVITESKILAIYEAQRARLPIRGIFSMGLLNQMINRELVYREAVRAKFDSGERDVIDEMLYFEEKFSKPEEFSLFLEEEGLLLGDIVEWLHKRQVTLAYINEKISVMSYIGARDVEKYYREHSENFEGRPFEEVEDEIRLQLLAKKGEEYLVEWISDLRKRGKVKYFIIPQDQPLY